ncbi:MAG: DUF4469 domain-containing protein [Candidatus Electronema sp. V4]|uniref:DUF4469 domain-containing protein n=1 Tax=Candidatus Electronema sp. V4 TaxID=3454756 RepID=UPI004055678B
MSIQYRIEGNPLTTPPSCRIQAVPRGTAGYEEMAADISAEQPIYSPETVSGLAPLIMKWIQQRLIGGDKVTLPEAFGFYISFKGRLDSPDDPLPDNDDLIQVNVRVSQPFVKEIRHKAKLERLPMTEKLPVISATEDTKLKLADVLFAGGVLKLTGSNLDFDESSPDCGCVLEGTAGGRIRQSTYASVSNSAVMLVPEIPAQVEAWQNEYTVTLTARYSKRGTLRSGTCRRKLRSPLTVTDLGHPNRETGILTGGTASAPYASVIDGAVSADEMLRVQAVVDSRTGQLLLSLLDMEEGGQAGAAVAVAANGNYTLQGFSGSAVSSLTVKVSDYAALLSLIRNSYAGRLADILEVRA